MKFLDVRSVALHEIQYDEPLRTSEPRVHDLARSLQVHGLIQFPVVDVATKRVISGRDRLAASLLNGAKTVEVRMVEGTPDELEALEVAENLERRHDDRHALRARYVAIMERAIGDKMSHATAVTTTPTGRPKAAHAQAVEAVAKLEGVKPGTIRQSEARAAKQAEPAAPVVAAESKEDRDVAAYNEAMLEAARAINLASRTLAGLANHEWLPTARAKRTRDEMKLLAKVLESEVLVGECPACEERGQVPRCGVCDGTHYVTEFQKLGAPKP
jgi:ParB-like chromosome segregation protein Spo0J